MNEQQEVILDALVGAQSFGDDYWSPGPLPFAVRALQAAGLTSSTDPPSALGYPLPLCVAVEGVCWTVKELDERRALAISLFTEVPPRSEPYERTPEAFVGAAVWSAEQAVRLCDPDSRHADAGLALLREGTSGAEQLLEATEAIETAIDDYHGSRAEFIQPKLALSVIYFALHALRRLRESAADVERPSSWAVRDAARLAGHTRAGRGALGFCIDLARHLGM